MSDNQYNIGLDKTPANYVPLSPLSFLARSAAVYPDQISTVYEGRSFTWRQTYERCRRFASYLAGKGIGVGDTVAAMLPNIPAMNEVHFAVPMAGAVLNALNIRLDAPSIAFQLDHGGAKIILVDPEFSTVITEALAQMKGPKPFVIDVDDASFKGGKRIGEIEYETAVAQGDPNFIAIPPKDEWDAIALSYTSGTTGNPKGVVTHHRGAYLVLVVQWDGYVVDPSAWRPDFRLYDYVGAPWPFVTDGFSVGNGGFSLQSQQFLRAMRDDRFVLHEDVHSDWQACRAFRPQLESEFGLRFAPQAVAEAFSHETLSLREFTTARPPTFGFHGMGNMWRYIDDGEMIAMADQLAPHVFASPHCAKLLVTYFLLGRYKTFAALYARLKAHCAHDATALIRTVVGEVNHDIAALFASLGDRLIAHPRRAWMLVWDLKRARRVVLERLAGGPVAAYET